MEKADLDQVTKLIADAIKPVSDAMTSLTTNQKVLADTMAADAKAKADAETKAKADADKAAADKAAADAAAKDKKEDAAPLTADAVTKLVSDGIAAAAKAQADAQQSSAARNAY